MKTRHSLIPLLVLALAGLAPVAGSESPLLKQIEQEFIAISNSIAPTVVEISVTGTADAEDITRMQDLFRFFGQPEGAPEVTPDPRLPQPPQLETNAMGSGFVFDELGHIVTNNHVVAEAESIRVRLHDGSEHEATLIGRDPSADIAVIKIEPNGAKITASKLGDSDALSVGQFAIAMGSPRGLTDSVSFGHVSALGREELRLPDPELRFQNFIQTDAAINLGNSGGPLCNIDGEVIGVNVAIAFGANSIGFAIPINTVKAIVPQLIENGRVVRGWLGVSIVDVDEAAREAGQEVKNYVDAFNLPDSDGAVVMGVARGGPAQEAGLLEDDVIRKIGDDPIRGKSELVNTVSAMPPGETFNVELVREGKVITVPVTLGEFPDMQTARFGPAYLGLRLMDVPAEVREALGLAEGAPDGVLVAQVVADSPAEAAGFRPGDLIAKVAHEDVEGMDSFIELLGNNAVPGKTMLVTVVRQGNALERLFIEVPEDFEMP
jgi:serine protease Do